MVRAMTMLALAIAGCDRSKAHGDPAAKASSVASSAPVPDAAPSPTCKADPGVVLPDSARATHVRIAAAGSKALVTFFESTKKSEGPGVDTAVSYEFDGATLGPRTKLEENDVGDEPISLAEPLAIGGDLFAIACAWAAPAGTYACTRTKPGDKSATLFAFAGIANGGPEKPDLAAVVKGDAALVVVPVGRELQLMSTRVRGKKKEAPFAARPDAQGSPPDALAAVLTADDEATIVYRHDGAISAHRAGFDEKWRGSAVDLSAKGTLVGAPAIASAGDRVVAVFSQRDKATDPWKVVLAELTATGAVKRTELAEAQGPGIAKAAEADCFHVSWVEGSGKATRTRLARACNGAVVASSVTTLSTNDVEGGRAYLAADPASPRTLFVVWQEIPRGKPAELRVAKLTCN